MLSEESISIPVAATSFRENPQLLLTAPRTAKGGSGGFGIQVYQRPQVRLCPQRSAWIKQSFGQVFLAISSGSASTGVANSPQTLQESVSRSTYSSPAKPEGPQIGPSSHAAANKTTPHAKRELAQGSQATPAIKYVKQRAYQLRRISESNALTGRGPHLKPTAVQRTTEPLLRVHKHSLVRKSSVVGAAARAVHRARALSAGRKAIKWSSRSANTRLTRVGNKSLRFCKPSHGTSSLSWRRTCTEEKSAEQKKLPPPLALKHTKRLHWSKERRPAAKLVRVNGSLYKIVRGAKGGTLKRQTPLAAPKPLSPKQVTHK